MASRALGAFFALAAAAAFVVSIATSAWWAGTPIVDGKPIAAKFVHAGPLGVIGCNVGGDGRCEAVTTSSTVQLVGYAALGATAVATLFLLILLVAAWRVSDHRRGFSTASTLVTLLATGAGGVLLALGPGIEASQQVQVPYGYGLFVFGGGALASLIASAITRRIEREPLRLKSSRRASRPAAQPAPSAQPSPHPHQVPHAQQLPQMQQAPQLQPAPHARQVPHMRQALHPQELPQMPLAPHALQLQHVHAAPGAVGAAPQAPSLPMRPPTPPSADPLGELIANLPIHPPPSPSASASPSPLAAVPPSPLAPAPAPPLASPPPPLGPRTKPPSMPPPRAKPASMPPAPRPRHHTPPGDAMRVKHPAPPRSVVPPPGPRSKIDTHQRPATELATPPPAEPKPVRGSKPALAAPPRKPPTAAPPPRSPTLATAVPPMPITDSQPVLGRPSTEDDDAPPLKLTPPANAKPAKRRSDTEMRTGKNRIADATDVGIPAAPEPAGDVVDDAKPAPPPVERTAETPVVAVTDKQPGEQTAQTLMAPEPKRRDPEDLMRTIEQGSKSPLPGGERPQTATPIPTVDAERAAQLPISTAPTSLPPPKQLDAVPSGPSPACPQCEAPMSWVDEHLRFYCRSCRMYF